MIFNKKVHGFHINIESRHEVIENLKNIVPVIQKLLIEIRLVVDFALFLPFLESDANFLVVHFEYSNLDASFQLNIDLVTVFDVFHGLLFKFDLKFLL